MELSRWYAYHKLVKYGLRDKNAWFEILSRNGYSEEDDDFSLCFICGEWFCNECIENLLPQNRCSACRTKRSEDAWIPYRLYSEDRDVDAKIQDERRYE